MALALIAGTVPHPARAGAPPPRAVRLDWSRPGPPVDRFFDLAIGADYPGTLIRPDTQAQLKTAVNELGFRTIRFHAIFHDVLGTVQQRDGQIRYDWSGIDRLYDQLLASGIRPFVELGFTPSALRSSDQQIFWWKGNTSHPRPAPWRDLVRAFVEHLRERYGAEEVRGWRFEVWNEPNLDGFWERADQQAYFALYRDTALVLKAIDPGLQVGGPATAGAAWVPEFLAFARQTDTPVDFVTTHSYGVDGGFLDEDGKADTRLSADPLAVIRDVRNVRAQIDSSPYRGIPLYFTEWSTSYTPRDFVHDSYVSAAYILDRLAGTAGYAQAMSYWTFTDLFEEPGPPPTPFHGGFGLMNREGIRKPAWFAYKYLAALKGLRLASADSAVMAARDGQSLSAVAWDWQQPRQSVSNTPFFGRLHPSTPSRPLALELTGVPAGRYRLLVHRTGYRANDAFSAYIAMGKPASLNPRQLARLQAITADRPERQRLLRVSGRGVVRTTVAMRSNDVVLIRLVPVGPATRRGPAAPRR
ncbi:beta-xylosidase [Novosphingobium piscinae]|uniref:GH39 family glycosyl hydrolase n=1 Tax=Novosphingobium piscinae TaxID=1507448 RepID=UPI0031B58223